MASGGKGTVEPVGEGGNPIAFPIHLGYHSFDVLFCPREERMGKEFEDFEHGVVTETRRRLKRPAMFKVLLHNDDYTTMEFVVQVLQSVFNRPLTEAMKIMLHVHRNGIGVAGVYTYEVAETKVAVVEAMAQQQEFPLKCSIEEA